MSRIFAPIIPGESMVSGAQVIDGSLKFDKGKSQSLSRTPSSAGNRRTFTISYWIKRTIPVDSFSPTTASVFGAEGGSEWFDLSYYTVDEMQFITNAGVGDQGMRTNAKYRDFSNFYHICAVVDTTQSTANDRMKVYVNGEYQTQNIPSGMPSQNYETYVNSTNAHHIGRDARTSSIRYGDHHLSQFYLIDGQALGPEYFGYTDPLTNTWRPKKLTTWDNPNNGTTWSSSLTGARTDNNFNTHAFDGSLTTKAGTPTVGGTLTFTPPSAIPYNSSIEVYTYWGAANDVEVSLNGGAAVTDPGNQWTTIATGSGSITSMTFTGTTNSGEVSAIKVDGVILIDGVDRWGTNGFYLPMDGNSPIGEDKSGRGNNWTPVNFGGSNTIEKATGAFPILNTDGGGKVARVGVRTDSNSSSLVLALPLVGADNDVSNQINSGTSAKTITNTGTAAASSAQSNFYGGSFYFDGSNDKLTSGTVSINQADFTVEAWVYFTNADTSNETVVEFTGTNRWIFGRKGTGSSSVMYFYDGSSERLSSTSVNDDAWHHMAWVKDGGIMYFYLDGIQIGSYNGSYGTTSSSTITVGRNADNYEPIDAYIQDVRVYNSAKYTSNFIPASTNPDILPDTPSGVSGGSKLTKITDGAVYFDGTGDYLFAGSSSDYTFGTGDFTIEGYFYFSSTSTPNNGLWQISGTSGGLESSNSTLSCNFETSGGRTNQLYMGSAGGWRQSGSDNEFTPKKWIHVAEVRNGGTISVYINGKLSQSWSDTTNYAFTDCVVGGYYSTSYLWNGFVSNFRVVKGTALYTSDFTPPTSPLTNVTNTKLLCCQSNTLAGSASVSPNISGINNGTVWSNYLSNVRTDNDFAVYGFDGSLTTKASTPTNGTTLTFTPPSAIPYSSTVEVYIYWGIVNDVDVSLNGGSAVTDPGNQWTTIATGSGSITSMTFTGTTNAGQVSAIRVDGVILKDPVTVLGNAAATTLNPFTTDINAVRGQESGYATLNPLRAAHTYSNGNLDWTFSTTGNTSIQPAMSTLVMESGKWFWETTIQSGATGIFVGIWNVDNFTNDHPGSTSDSYAYWSNNGNKYNNDSNSSYGSAFTTVGTVVGTAYDADNGTIEFFNNGISQGVAYSGITQRRYVAAYHKGTPGTDVRSAEANFGQKPFKFPPPEGFQPLNAANVRPETVIARPDQYVGIATYTGTTDNPATITSDNINFTPDLVWVKYRDGTESHALYDTVRGVTKRLRSDTTAIENTGANELQSFIPGGFTAGNNGHIYYNGYDYVAWTWKAGGGTGITTSFWKDDVDYGTASAAGLTAGTIIPTGASVGTKQGFSIISYTGTSTASDTVPHGLDETPSLILVKNRTSTVSSGNWNVWHSSLGTTKNLELNTTIAANTTTLFGYGIVYSDSSTVIKFSGGGNTPSTANINNSGTDYVAYCWHDVPGLQKFGTYTGNANADGPFVELGFSPKVIWIKRSSTGGGNWICFDIERDKYNFTYKALYLNSDTLEGDLSSYTPLDILSNGFKLRDNASTLTGNTNLNISGGTYVYCAWAEAPSFNLYGAQSNAR